MIKAIKDWFKKTFIWLSIVVISIGSILLLIIKLMLTRQKAIENGHISDTMTQGAKDDETANNIDNAVNNSPFIQSRKDHRK